MISEHKIILDTATDPSLFVWDGYAGGMTVLLDKDGKPLITKIGVEIKKGAVALTNPWVNLLGMRVAASNRSQDYNPSAAYL